MSMTRTLRRAAERKAAKQARKAAVTAPQATPAQIAANQANAQLSTGPTSEAGKATSSKNALKTALTGRTVLLPGDDTTAYDTLIAKFFADHAPATPEEQELVQTIADTTWRLRRIVNLEFAIYAKGALEFEDQFSDLEPAVRAQMIQVETYLEYEKSIRNLNTQEARLQRHLAKAKAELTRLQTERTARELQLQTLAAARAKQPVPPPPAASEIGFEFSPAALARLNISLCTTPEPADALQSAA